MDTVRVVLDTLVIVQQSAPAVPAIVALALSAGAFILAAIAATPFLIFMGSR